MCAVASPGKDPAAVVCGRCRRGYAHADWVRLERVQTLTADEVRNHVLVWSRERSIEVRACATCGHGIARTAR